ncbi:MAG: FIST signal transduction protein [Omnitrophica WOR_2 bacterium]
MALIAAVGHAGSVNGREAGSEATRKALDQLGLASPSFGLVLASQDFRMPEVWSGINSLLKDIPVLGFSTPAELAGDGYTERSVLVALLAGAKFQVSAGYWNDVSGNKLVDPFKIFLQPAHPGDTLLLAGNGLSADVDYLIGQLNANRAVPEQAGLRIGGCLSGSLAAERSYQIGGYQCGSKGLAAALLNGDLTTGIGVAHGWQPVGKYFHVTQAASTFIYSLDGQPAAEVYAQLFGGSAREWCSPPLNELVRLYPLEIEPTNLIHNIAEPEGTYQVRSPLKMEADGSLRMNAIIPESSIAHLLAGSPGLCLEAAQRAARQALDDLRRKDTSIQPALAVLLVDAAWRTILRADPGSEIAAVRSVLGEAVPIMGGYTLGQITNSGAERNCAELLNQHICVLLFA